MEDVARLAGVNKATVSRALRGDSRISQATRERVWRIAKQLGYRLDLSASSLSGGKTGIAALVLGEMEPWLTGAFFDGLNRVLSRIGLDILIKLPGFHPDEIFSNLTARHVDCILWAGEQDTLLPPRSMFPSAPFVTAGFSSPGTPAVLLSPELTVERLSALTDGTHMLRYSGGKGRLHFPFLSDLILPRKNGEKNVFTVFDGMDHFEVAQEKGIFCTPPGSLPPKDLYSLEWPAFEFGVTAARVLANLLQGQSNVPETTLLVPALKSPEGEQLPFVK